MAFFSIFERFRQKKAEKIAFESEINSLRSAMRGIDSIDGLFDYAAKKAEIIQKMLSSKPTTRFAASVLIPMVEQQQAFVEKIKNEASFDPAAYFAKHVDNEIRNDMQQNQEVSGKVSAVLSSLDNFNESLKLQKMAFLIFSRRKEQIEEMISKEQEMLLDIRIKHQEAEDKVLYYCSKIQEKHLYTSRSINAAIARMSNEIIDIMVDMNLNSMHSKDKDCSQRKAAMNHLILKMKKLDSVIAENLVMLSKLKKSEGREKKLFEMRVEIKDKVKSLEAMIKEIDLALDAYKKNVQQDLATILPKIFPIHRDFASKLIFPVQHIDGEKQLSVKEYFEKISFMMNYGIKAEVKNEESSDSALKAIYFTDKVPEAAAYLVMKDTTKYAIFRPLSGSQFLIFKPLIKEDFELVVRANAKNEIALGLMEICTEKGVKFTESSL
jgi:hypothetical protein